MRHYHGICICEERQSKWVLGQVSTNEGRKETALCRFQDPLPKDNHTYGLNCFSDND